MIEAIYKIEIGDKKLELTKEEAEQLYDELTKALNKYRLDPDSHRGFLRPQPVYPDGAPMLL